VMDRPSHAAAGRPTPAGPVLVLSRIALFDTSKVITSR
jgi:hypothetical protein